MTNLYTKIPKVDEILLSDVIKPWVSSHGQSYVVEQIREETDRLRALIREGITNEHFDNELELFLTKCEKRLEKGLSPCLKKVINGTGVVLHTNLGRAPMNKNAIREMVSLAEGYSNLEYDLSTGQRGSRYALLVDHIKAITKAEDAMVVNNNAAAVLLVLSTFAKGKKVITSRGELIEIGGSFRIPDVCRESGAQLSEVGTTNKTHLDDYKKAMDEDTAMILKVHTSNYKVVGFTSAVNASELASLAHVAGCLIYEDLGSGVLTDLREYGLDYEPTVQESVQNGIDLISFSGDKLLGGPQAGIIVGRKCYIDAMKKNPLTRALRVDKLTIGALERTLICYRKGKEAIRDIPVLQMLQMPLDQLINRAQRLRQQLIDQGIDEDLVQVEKVDSEVGGGSLPTTKLPSAALVILEAYQKPNELEKWLRQGEIPIIGRIANGCFLLDLRTIFDDDFDFIVHQIMNKAR